METKEITLNIQVSVIDGQQMPDEQRVLDKIVDYLYDYSIDDAARIDSVHVTHIDGNSTDELE